MGVFLFVALIEYILRVWSNIIVKKLINTGEIDNCSLKDGNQWEITTVTLENGISIYIRSKDETEPLLRAEKRIFMQRTNKIMNMKQPQASFVDTKNRFMNYLCMIKQMMIS